MSQARGRYSGSRDKDQRQSRQPSKTTTHRQNKPFVKNSPARDPAQTASIFKTRSFKLLVDAVGAENIALALDSNLTRVAELVNGERFTPETAFHIETTLGLPDGFFDEPNPVLTPEIVARLKSPLDFIHAHVEPESMYEEVFTPAPVTQVKNHPAPMERLPKESEMPRKTNGGSQRAVARGNAVETKPERADPAKSAPVKGKGSSKSGTQQSLPLNDAVTLENIRRANLHVLTSRNGSKARLGAVMEISGSNMAHRLHGQKRMDDAEAKRFTERLGLPIGWLDLPRSVPDIPESVSALLVPASRRHASTQQERPPAVEPTSTPAKKPASTKAQTASARHTHTPDAGKARVPRSVAPETNAIPMLLDQPLPPASDPALAQLVDTDVSFFAARQQIEPTSVAPIVTEVRRLTSTTSLEDLQGIEPIAEALIKTLAGKARTGRLDEMKALELLQQAVLL
jgi:hypothetical protein